MAPVSRDFNHGCGDVDHHTDPAYRCPFADVVAWTTTDIEKRVEAPHRGVAGAKASCLTQRSESITVSEHVEVDVNRRQMLDPSLGNSRCYGIGYDRSAM